MELKKCQGYYGKCYHSEDMMVPVEMFSANRSSKDGLHQSCKRCNVEQHKKADPKSNAISKAAYKIAGSQEEYFKLPKEKRMELRAIAKEEYTVMHEKPEPKENIWNRKVLPIFKRGGKSKPMTTRETVKVEGRREPQGWVYAICNPDHTFVLKVGKTYTDGIEDRLSEARRWGRAKLVGKWYFLDALQAETLIHQKLYKYNLRVLGFEDVGKELFKCFLYDVERAVEETQKELEPSVSEG